MGSSALQRHDRRRRAEKLAEVDLADAEAPGERRADRLLGDRGLDRRDVRPAPAGTRRSAASRSAWALVLWARSSLARSRLSRASSARASALRAAPPRPRCPAAPAGRPPSPPRPTRTRSGDRAVELGADHDALNGGETADRMQGRLPGLPRPRRRRPRRRRLLRRQGCSSCSAQKVCSPGCRRQGGPSRAASGSFFWP